nr:hypothetical protein DBT45_12005 [Aerococcus tenax]
MSPHEAARMNQILGIIDYYLFQTWSGTIAFERLVATNLLGRPSDEERIAAAVPMARLAAEAVEDLNAGPYLTGDTYSLADIRLLPHFQWFRFTPEGEAVLAGKKKLAQWLQLASERPSARSVLQQ